MLDPLDKVVTFVPASDANAVVDALAAAGAGAIGAYDRCAFLTTGEGTFRPGSGAAPAIGTVGEIEVVRRASGSRWCCTAIGVPTWFAALRATHPYEEPAFDVSRAGLVAQRPRHRPGGHAGGSP